MKKIAIVLAAAWLVAACSPKEVINTISSKVFTASIEQGTRTFTDGTKVYWIEDEEISIFDKSTSNVKYVYAGETGETSGPFVDAGEAVSPGDPLTYTYAIYPYTGYNEVVAENVVYSYIEPQQYYYGNTFDPYYGNSLVAISDNESLKFKNAVGYLKLRLIGDGSTPISYIDIKSNNGEYITGDFYASFASLDADPVIVATDDYYYAFAEAIVAFDDEAPVYLDASNPLDVWVGLLPADLSGGITVTVIGADKREFTYSSSNPLSIKRGVCTPTAPLKVQFPDLPDEDPVVKAYIEENIEGKYKLATYGSDSKDCTEYWTIIYNLTVSGNITIIGTLCGQSVELTATFDPGTSLITIDTDEAVGSYYGYDLFITFADDTSYLNEPITFSVTGPHALSFNNPKMYYLNLIFYYNSGWNYIEDMFIDSITYQGAIASSAPVAKIKRAGGSKNTSSAIKAVSRKELPISAGLKTKSVVK